MSWILAGLAFLLLILLWPGTAQERKVQQAISAVLALGITGWYLGQSWLISLAIGPGPSFNDPHARLKAFTILCFAVIVSLWAAFSRLRPLRIAGIVSAAVSLWPGLVALGDRPFGYGFVPFGPRDTVTYSNRSA